MYEQLQLLKNFVRLAWLYRWVGVGIAISSSVGGWVYVYMMPDEYQVDTKIYLDATSALRPMLKGLAVRSSSLKDTALVLRRTLLTRPNLEDVARRADLDLKASTPAQFDAIVERLGRSITVRDTKRDQIYDISYTDSDPKQAKLVIDELLNIFLESSLGDSRRETAVTQRFLEEQIAEYEKRLIAAEERLVEFKQRNVGTRPGSQGGYFARLQSIHEKLRQAQLDLQEAEKRRDEIKNLANLAREQGGEAALNVVTPQTQALDERILGLETRIDNTLLNFTEKHPDVIAMRRTIVQLEERKEAAIAEYIAGGAGALGAAAAANSYEEQIKLQVVEAGGAVAALQTRVAEYNRRAEELARKVDTVPEVEAELKRLDRDYNINKSQYNKLLKKRETAYLSREADATEDDVKIKIIEPPRIPLAPSGPPRLLWISVIFLVSLGIGGVVAFVLSQLNPRILGDADLRSVTGIAILGAVGMTQNALHRRRRRLELALFMAVISGLGVVYGGQVFLMQTGVDLRANVTSVIGAIL